MRSFAKPTPPRPPALDVPACLDWIRESFRGSPDCVMVLDTAGRVQSSNRDMPSPTGTDVAPQFGGFFGPEPDVAIRQALEHAVETRQPARLEARAPRPDGSQGWYRISFTPVLRDAQVATLTAIATDITELKREEERLRRSEAMMVDTQGVAHLGVWDWDITQPHATWSPELYRIYGLDPATYVPSYENYLAKVHPDDRQRVMEATNSVFHELKPYSHDERIYRVSGELRYLHTWASPVLDDAGKLVRLMGVCQDITDRKLVENAVAEHAAQLSRMNADLEQFARVAAHDLQEPLRTVASFTQLLEVQYRGQLDADADETIGFIVQGVHKMKAVISDLLEYSQLSVQPEAMRPVDLAERLARVRDALAAQFAESGGAIQHAQLPVVSADPQRVQQLLTHLVANAIRFRGPQPPWIEVSAKAGDGMVEVTVQDNGIGIAPAHLERVFVIFQRLNPDVPGTGAGLAISKKIVELHGGRIWAESAPGEGTAIHFTLPAFLGVFCARYPLRNP